MMSENDMTIPMFIVCIASLIVLVVLLHGVSLCSGLNCIVLLPSVYRPLYLVMSRLRVSCLCSHITGAHPSETMYNPNLSLCVRLSIYSLSLYLSSCLHTLMYNCLVLFSFSFCFFLLCAQQLDAEQSDTALKVIRMLKQAGDQYLMVGAPEARSWYIKAKVGRTRGWEKHQRDPRNADWCDDDGDDVWCVFVLCLCVNLICACLPALSRTLLAVFPPLNSG